MCLLYALLGVLMSMVSLQAMAEGESKAYFYAGGYTQQLPADEKANAGIGLWSVDTQSGVLSQESGPWPLANPSYQALSPNQSFLYSVNEIANFDSKKDGAVSAFSVDSKTRELTLLGTVSSNGPIPAFLSVDATGKYVVVANYTGGNVSVYPIQADGSLGEASANEQHVGTIVDKSRQEAPHPHSAVVSPDNNYVFVPDLGLDVIKAYAFDATKGTLVPKPTLDVKTLPGSGPRHLAFHPSGKYAFCALEMGNRLVSYRYADGQLTKVGDYSSVPERLKGKSYTSEVRVSPNGKFVYIANRGHDSIAGFALNEETGELARIQIESVVGKWPRNFAIDPSGTMMVVANQHSNTLDCLKVDPETGLLSPTGKQASMPAPAYICFIQP